MNKQLLSNNYLFWLWFLLILSSCIANTSFADINQDKLPDNARKKSYGRGWVCNPGYQQVGKTCEAIRVPENAYLTHSSYGVGWKCHWGYRQFGNRCREIVIPANAYLDINGYDWKCDRGYKAHNDGCMAIQIPKNGYLVNTTYGKGWKCERGYVEKKNACAPLAVPSNAHINYSGDAWDCNPPYTRRQGECMLTPK